MNPLANRQGDGHDALFTQCLDNPCGVPHMTTPPTRTTGLPELRLECYNR